MPSNSNLVPLNGKNINQPSTKCATNHTVVLTPEMIHPFSKVGPRQTKSWV